MRLLPLLFGAALLSTACGSKPPPRWQEGGAPLLITPARWDRPDDDPITIREDGKVLEGNDILFVVDRAGRVVDNDYEPVALLMPDGHIAGPDNSLLGRIGHANAAPPDSAAAWLAILPNGQVIRFDEEGDRHDAGVWRGCEGPQKRTCTLITHVLWVRDYIRNRRSGVGVGVGVGVGF